MRRERNIGKRKSKFVLCTILENEKKKRLERANGKKCYGWQNEKRKKDREKKKKSQKSKLYFVQSWEIRKKKWLERKPNGQKCYGKKLMGKGQPK